MVNYSLILFDLGDVLATFDPASRLAAYANRCGLSPAVIKERLATDDFWVNTDCGLFSGDEMHSRISTLLEHEFSRDQLRQLQAAAFTVRPEMVAMARDVAATTDVGILTNNAPLLAEAFPTYLPELTALFDPILFSFQFNSVKPEPELFHGVRARLGLAADAILLIDDQAGHIAAARAAGWQAVRFESAAQIRQALTRRGLLQVSD